MRRLSELKDYPRNTRTHPQAQVDKLAEMLRRWGPDQPIVVDEDDVIIKGHGRKLAGLAAGFLEFPTIKRTGLPEDEKRAMRIADNQVGLLAGWDNALMQVEVGDLKNNGYDMKLLAFSEAQLRSFGAGPAASQANPDDIPKAPTRPVVRAGDLWSMGRHRLLCGDATKPESWTALFAGGERASMVFTDPPYGVSYQDQSGTFDVIEGDKKRRDDLYKMLLLSIKSLVRHAADTAAFYIWHASSTREDFAQAMKAAGLAERQYLMWVKPSIVFGRADYQWQHEPCQPAGTLVNRVVGSQAGRGRPSTIESVPIETLREGDRVVSFDSYAGKTIRRGREITRFGSRRYEGNMHTVCVAGRQTRATADHRFTVRMDSAAAGKHIIYLMRRGDWWRVGVVKVFNSRGFALGVRLTDERADAAWIVAVCDDYLAARVTEQATSCLYGIPTTHWETSNQSRTIRSKDHIGQIYAQVGVGFIGEGARRLLKSRGLEIDDPIVAKGEREPTSRKKTRLIRARNLIPGIMQLPIPTEGERVEWHTISAAQFEHYDGTVYSMDVDRDRHYVADGIITHNCFYAAKADHSPAFHGERAESTVWHVQLARNQDTAVTVGNGVLLLDGAGASLYVQSRAPKGKKLRQVRITADGNVYLSGSDRQDGTVWEVARDSGYVHPTQKPVELARRAIENSSLPGEIVADGFLGSGTTLIGAEMTGRRCYGTEMDPTYAEVIVRRWEALTGQRATMQGQTLEQVARARRSPAGAPKKKRGGNHAAPSRNRAGEA